MEKHDHMIDPFFMQRALDLALLGRGHVSPNPLVGSVITHDGRIIGEGWHQRYGEAHAEVNAINSVMEKHLLSESIVYVNLEPCSHTGKTPPCADLLIKHKVRKVIVANLDSNPLVSGSGVAKLRAAGIDVTIDVMAQAGRELNKRFFTMMEKQRPYIILKWAETADGFIARTNFDSKWISNAQSRQLVHKWRSEEDAILVGSRTALHDNPRLNVRDWTGRNPVRIVIDRHLTLPDTLSLFDGSQPTICYNIVEDKDTPNLLKVRLDEMGFMTNLIRDLYSRKIQSVIVEGGSTILSMFTTAGLWDEARIFISPQRFGTGIPAPVLAGVQIHETRIGTDLLKIFKPAL